MAGLTEDLDYVGTEKSLRFKIGQLVEFTVQVVDDDNNILDITGRSYQAKIGAGGGSTAVASFSYTITNALQGLVKFSLDSSVVVSLVAGHYRLEVWENNSNFLFGGPVEVLSKEVI